MCHKAHKVRLTKFEYYCIDIIDCTVPNALLYYLAGYIDSHRTVINKVFPAIKFYKVSKVATMLYKVVAKGSLSHAL